MELCEARFSEFGEAQNFPAGYHKAGGFTGRAREFARRHLTEAPGRKLDTGAIQKALKQTG